MKKISDLCFDKKSGCCLDLYLPEQEQFSVFLYFHGGGLKTGSKEDAAPFAEFLTDRGIAVVSADYRMYPDARYPDFVEDAAAAAAWTWKHMHQYGKVDGLYIGGSSAGAYLTQLLCFDPDWLGAHGMTAMNVSGFLHDAGQPTCHFNVLRERGFHHRRVIIDETAPLYHVGRQEDYPPMLLIVSDQDIKNRYEQTMLLVSTMKHFGHEDKVRLKVLHGGHCAYLTKTDADGNNVFGTIVLEYIDRFIKG